MTLVSVISPQNSLVSSFFLETIKALDGKVYNLSYHQERLESVLDSLEASEYYDLSSLLSPPKKGLYRCRVVYDSKEINISYIKYAKREVKSFKLIYDDSIVYDKKYAKRDLIDMHFTQKDANDEIIIVKNGLITDTSIANIALYDGKKWFTPKSPLLKGTTRKRYLDEEKIFEADIDVNALKSYKKLALMNAMIDFDIIAENNLKGIIC